MDAINAVDSVTFEMDQKLGTQYHERFIHFLKMMQAQDLTVDGAMTDPKGDRSLPPSKQTDPDLYMRVVEKRKTALWCGAPKGIRRAPSIGTGCL